MSVQESTIRRIRFGIPHRIGFGRGRIRDGLWSGFDEIAESLRTTGDSFAGVIDLGGSVPQHVELEIRGRSLMALLEIGAPLSHDGLGYREGILRFGPIRVGGSVTTPGFGLYLKSRNFAFGTLGFVVVAGLDQRECTPAIQRESRSSKAQPNRQQEQGRCPRRAGHSSANYSAVRSGCNGGTEVWEFGSLRVRIRAGRWSAGTPKLPNS